MAQAGWRVSPNDWTMFELTPLLIECFYSNVDIWVYVQLNYYAHETKDSQEKMNNVEEVMANIFDTIKALQKHQNDERNASYIFP